MLKWASSHWTLWPNLFASVSFSKNIFHASWTVGSREFWIRNSPMWQIQDSGFSVMNFTYKLNWVYELLSKNHSPNPSFIHPSLSLWENFISYDSYQHCDLAFMVATMPDSSCRWHLVHPSQTPPNLPKPTLSTIGSLIFNYEEKIFQKLM